MKTLFLIKKQKFSKTGLTPILCRITYEKSRKQFSTGLFINPDYWNKEKQKVLDSSENSECVNKQLSLIKEKLSQARMAKTGKTISFPLLNSSGSKKF